MDPEASPRKRSHNEFLQAENAINENRAKKQALEHLGKGKRIIFAPNFFPVSLRTFCYSIFLFAWLQICCKIQNEVS